MPRLLPGLATAGTLMGMAIVVVGQAVLDPFADTVQRLIGGSILLVAAVLVVRWTLHLWSDTRDALREDRVAALEREQMYLEQINVLNRQLTAERQLRVSLERAGLIDRRHTDDGEAP